MCIVNKLSFEMNSCDLIYIYICVCVISVRFVYIYLGSVYICAIWAMLWATDVSRL